MQIQVYNDWFQIYSMKDNILCVNRGLGQQHTINITHLTHIMNYLLSFACKSPTHKTTPLRQFPVAFLRYQEQHTQNTSNHLHMNKCHHLWCFQNTTAHSENNVLEKGSSSKKKKKNLTLLGGKCLGHKHLGLSVDIFQESRSAMQDCSRLVMLQSKASYSRQPPQLIFSNSKASLRKIQICPIHSVEGIIRQSVWGTFSYLDRQIVRPFCTFDPFWVWKTEESELFLHVSPFSQFEVFPFLHRKPIKL